MKSEYMHVKHLVFHKRVLVHVKKPIYVSVEHSVG